MYPLVDRGRDLQRPSTRLRKRSGSKGKGRGKSKGRGGKSKGPKGRGRGGGGSGSGNEVQQEVIAPSAPQQQQQQQQRQQRQQQDNPPAEDVSPPPPPPPPPPAQGDDSTQPETPAPPPDNTGNEPIAIPLRQQTAEISDSSNTIAEGGDLNVGSNGEPIAASSDGSPGGSTAGSNPVDGPGGNTSDSIPEFSVYALSAVGSLIVALAIIATVFVVKKKYGPKVVVVRKTPPSDGRPSSRSSRPSSTDTLQMPINSSHTNDNIPTHSIQPIQPIRQISPEPAINDNVVDSPSHSSIAMSEDLEYAKNAYQCATAQMNSNEIVPPKSAITNNIPNPAQDMPVVAMPVIISNTMPFKKDSIGADSDDTHVDGINDNSGYEYYHGKGIDYRKGSIENTLKSYKMAIVGNEFTGQGGNISSYHSGAQASSNNSTLGDGGTVESPGYSPTGYYYGSQEEETSIIKDDRRQSGSSAISAESSRKASENSSSTRRETYRSDFSWSMGLATMDSPDTKSRLASTVVPQSAKTRVSNLRKSMAASTNRESYCSTEFSWSGVEAKVNSPY